MLEEFSAACHTLTPNASERTIRMKLGFAEAQTLYNSGSQNARQWTEAWVRTSIYCPSCANMRIEPFPNNSKLADFHCTICNEEYELKSRRGKFGRKVLDGDYKVKCERLAAKNNPKSIAHELRPQVAIGR